MNNTWLIAPPHYILFLISILAFILGVKGCKDKRNRLVKLRSWLTVIVSSLLSLVILSVLLLSSFASSLQEDVHFKTIHSPENNYTIDFYRWDSGSAGTFGVRGEWNGPLWFKKRIYYEEKTKNITVEWTNNDMVSINNHALNLDEGETYRE
ncbi:hypothetical protein J2S78_002656 [Salibacterium salarium]|nr:hypothetical protein [Salibacterium salarium]